MHLAMKDVNITNFRKDLFNYVDTTVRYGTPWNISTRNGNVVLINKEELESILETLYISSVPGMRESIVESMNKIKSGDLSDFTPMGDLTLEEFLDKVENEEI